MTQAVDHPNFMFGIGTHSVLAVMQCMENPYYAKPILAGKEYRQATWLRDDAIRTRAALTAQRPHTPPWPTAGDAIDEWLSATAEFAAAETEWKAKDEALAKLIAHCDGRIQLAGADTTTVLGSLQTDLDDLMTNVAAAVDQLGGARTPAEVIAVGPAAVPAWTRLVDLRHEYDRIRAAQALAARPHPEMATARSNYLDDELASDTHIANLDDVFPSWRDNRTSPPISMDLSANHRPQPWPEDPVCQLIWLSESGAQPWTPTIEQLNSLWTRRRERMAHPQPTKRGVPAHA